MRHRLSKSPGQGISAVLTTLLLVNLAMSVYQLPLNRTIERRLCNEYSTANDPSVIPPHGGDIDEHLCKIEGIQKKLGSLQGVMDTIWVLGDFVMTIPLGFLAQKRGHRLVLALNLISRLFMLSWAVLYTYLDAQMPTNAIVVGPMLSFLGGECVLSSILYSLTSELTDDAGKRATYFGYMSSVSYVVALLGPALSSATMSVLLPLPFFIGIGLLAIALPTIARLPSRATDSSDPVTSEEGTSLLSSPILKARDASSPSIFTSVITHIRSLYCLVTSHPRNFSLLLFSFFLTSLASSDTKLLVQYISGRYHWTFASAGYLLSGKAIVNFTLLTVILPRFLLNRPKFTDSPDTVDATNAQYAQYCLGISVAGALGIAVAAGMWMLVPSLLVYAVGSALPIFTLSLLKSTAICPQKEPGTNLVEGDDTPEAARGQIWSIVMLVKTLGSLLGAPLMAALWVSGISVGSMGMGMPFFVSSACYVIAIFVFTGIKV